MIISGKLVGWSIFALISYNSAITMISINDDYNKIIKLQRRNNYQVTTSQQQWEDLTQFRKGWVEYFKDDISATTSRHELFKKLKLDQTGLSTPITKIINSDSEDVIHNEVNVQLKNVCVANTPIGLVLNAKNISDMLKGLKKLKERQSISFSSLTLLNKEGYPEVIIRDLCVLIRAENEV